MIPAPYRLFEECEEASVADSRELPEEFQEVKDPFWGRPAAFVLVGVLSAALGVIATKAVDWMMTAPKVRTLEETTAEYLAARLSQLRAERIANAESELPDRPDRPRRP